MLNYPANRYMLVLWNHGGGWRETGWPTSLTKGVAWDETDNHDYLELREVKSALTAVKANTGQDIDLLGFDACIMGLVEVAYELRDAVTDVVIASQENEPHFGWYYTGFLQDLQGDPTATSAQLSTYILKWYAEVCDVYCSTYGRYCSTTLAAYDMTVVENVASCVQTFADRIQQTPEWDVLRTARDQAMKFDKAWSYVDLHNLASYCADHSVNATTANAAAALRDTLDQFVILNHATGKNANAMGVNIYFPPEPTGEWRDYVGDNCDFAEVSGWRECLTALFEAKVTAFPLSNNVPHEDEVSAGDADRYHIDVPEGATTLTVATTNTSGDVLDLYLSIDVPPTIWEYDVRAYTTSGDETILVDETTTPEIGPGRYHVLVDGYDGGEYTITASYATAPSDSFAVPVNLTAQSGSDSYIYLSWEAPDTGGISTTELVYDDGEPSIGYYWDVHGRGFANTLTMPADGGTLHSVKYYTTDLGIDIGGDGTFTVRIFGDASGLPGEDLITPFTYTPDALGWVEIDVSAADIHIPGDSDFYVGIFYDGVSIPSVGADLEDNGRAWDYQDGVWYTWDETYFIRAVVDVSSEDRVTLGEDIPSRLAYRPSAKFDLGSKHRRVADKKIKPSRGIAGYRIYRSGTSGSGYALIGTSVSPTYIDEAVVGGGTYYYVVTAAYVSPDGESPYSNEASATAGGETTEIELTDGTPLEGNVGPFGNSSQRYYIDAPDTATLFRVQTSNTIGDALDLYLAFGYLPTQNDYDIRAYTTSGNETIVMDENTSPPLQAGRYHVLVLGWFGGIYTITATYSGTSAALETPTDLAAESGRSGQVPLNWNFSGEIGAEGELIYDDNIPEGGYCWDVEGWGMASRMTMPEGGGTIQQVKYFITELGPGEGRFTVKILADSSGQPGSELIVPFTHTPYAPGWVTIDVSSSNISVEGDFYVGIFYDGVNTPNLGYDSVDNGRAWDYIDGIWLPWTETYFVRAIVEASRGIVRVSPPGRTKISRMDTSRVRPKKKYRPFDITGVKLSKGPSGFRIYRSKASGAGYVWVGTSIVPQYVDYDVANGETYYYVVTAVYTSPEGESGRSNEANATPVGTEVVELTNNIPLDGTVAPDGFVEYCIDVPEGVTAFTVATTNTSGDVLDLYLSIDVSPTPWQYDFDAYTDSGDETIVVDETTTPAIRAGRYSILVAGWDGGEYTITASYGVFSVSLPRISVCPGQMVRIPVYLDVIGEVPFFSASLSVAYDSDIVKAYEPCIIGALAEDWSVTHHRAQGSGTSIDTVYVGMTATMDMVSAGTLFYIQAIASQHASPGDTTALMFTQCQFNYGIWSSYGQDGVLRIVSMLGDVSGNGEASAYDASLVLQEVVGRITLPDPNWPAFTLATADVTGNGMISSLDASWILRYAVGLADAFPVESAEIMEKAAASERKIALGPMEKQTEGHLSIPVLIDEMDGVVAGEIMLVFERTGGAGGDVRVRSTELTSDYLFAHNVQDGSIKVSFAGAESRTGAGTVLEVVFDEWDAELLSSLRLDRVSLNEGRIPVRIVGKEVETPEAHRLSQNYPNPFNPQTTIPYDVAKAGAVRLSIHTLTGQRVRTLVDGECPPGSFSVVWDGRGDAGRGVASGVYLCRMEAGGEYRAVRKMLLMR